MKILKQAPNEPTVIELPPDWSLMAWDPDGRLSMAIPEGDDAENVNGGMVEAALAMMALKDDGLRKVLLERLGAAEEDDDDE